MEEPTIQRSLRIPKKLIDEIEKRAQESERNFTQQVVFLLKKALSHE